MFALVTLIICFIYIFPLFYCEFAVLCYSYWVILKEMLISLVTLCYRQGRLTVHSSRTGDFHLTPKNSCLGTKPRSISRQWTWIFPEATRGEKINLRGKKNTQMCGMEASSFHSPLFFSLFLFFPHPLFSPLLSPSPLPLFSSPFLLPEHKIWIPAQCPRSQGSWRCSFVIT